MKFIRNLLLALSAVALIAAAVVWLGVYDVAADQPHWRPTARLLEWVRDRSIDRRAAAVEVPELRDPALIRSGAGNYDAMCASCHLSPDALETELSIGLYPRPPRWDALGNVDARRMFQVVKHGIKGSGMPAWGRSMEDRYLWGMVAFMQQFPSMTAAQYRAQVGASPGHSHGGGESGAAGSAPVEPPREPVESGAAQAAEADDPAAHEHAHDHDH